MKTSNEVYSINEISELTGFKPHVIRFYEKEFQLKIPRDTGNRRYFTYRELEDLLYIKSMQEKGLTNPQIKQVLKSPKIAMDSKTKKEVAVSAPIKLVRNEEKNYDVLIKEATQYLSMQVSETIKNIDTRKEIAELSEKIDELKNQLNNQEKDVLICENAKLKMKVKEKSYEVAELKDKLKREQTQKKSLFERMFSKNNTSIKY
ncbi:helix-turn-helix domain-containing protein [Alkaliphilus peptidifermentans]|uniref:MerR HTH family regulatory protein n=1 Tax=Alkaliphilus peptidifermentans DSM 18978 TaxID=1120976 RepID=A0A1G5KKZ4_9FIRM|nr:helix-turn-helix domain-containing protein [Alkaliphilus peptidifermentans]SCZ01275.1 MerR HTH family regulatory protein [Alkaliphilus peptidifermentans DSM 18978]